MAALITRATVDEISKKDLSIYRHEEEKDACEYIQNACASTLLQSNLKYTLVCSCQSSQIVSPRVL